MLVITSYSIHYTKLYETALGILGDIQGAKKMFDFALTLDSESYNFV